jgi:preprotein translocase subunit SecA
MLGFARKLFGSVNDRKIRPMKSNVARINALEPAFEALSDEALRNKTSEFRQRLAAGAKLDSLLPEAFATVREASKRTLGLRHFDVQLLGGMVLHSGAISEMRTGEGKTLVATLPTYLNALPGKGVHVITVNDYLAQRDAEWMSQIYRFLGLTTGVIVHGKNDQERRAAYHSDITYGTNNEFGFDYLRDNMKYSLPEMVQRPHNFAIVDEVDSILVDEARTPLIISGPTEDRSEFYRRVDLIIPLLSDDDFEVDEKQRSIVFTEKGQEHIEEMLQERGILDGALYDPNNVSIVHHANQALRAHKLFHRDKEYIVKDNEVVLIDEFTGRMMPGRRLSEGLHQAIEAKEGTEIQPENQTLASITFQNYFRLYQKLAGMTGTASTEASEFSEIYKLEVAEVPTNKPVLRIDIDDEVYRTAKEKYAAIITDIEDTYSRRQPVLVGTVSIEKSEQLSAMLKERGVPHQVLNARYHEQEAAIVAQAGVPGAVTIATNMAGRGTDIQLGGNVEFQLRDEVARLRAERSTEPSEAEVRQLRDRIAKDVEEKKVAALGSGGLYVLGTERHESRRIDNQLRGRTGRQGDPGKSKFYICLEDDLLRIFAADRLDAIMRGLGIQEGEAIVHPWMNKALETSQRRVEQRNFEIRKNLLKFDDVINDQRKAVFEQRIELMQLQDVAPVVKDMRHQTVEDLVNKHLPPKAYAEQWDITGLDEQVQDIFGLKLPLREWAAEEGIANEEINERMVKETDRLAASKVAALGPERMRWIEKQVLLQIVDNRWRDHLAHIDHLRSVIHLRGYAQRDPLNEFKTECFAMFEQMLFDLRSGTTRALMRLQVDGEPQIDLEEISVEPADFVEIHQDPQTGENEMDEEAWTPPPGFKQDDVSTWGRVARNASCPCGSGKKFKHCHGKVAVA